MARRKKVSEQEYAVELSDPTKAPIRRVKSVTKIVVAPTEGDALKQAVQGDPNRTNKLARVYPRRMEVPEQPAMATPTVPQVPQAESRRSDTKALVERATYPYGLMLPLTFRPLLEEANVGDIFGMSEYNGRIYAKIHTAKAMKKLIEHLKRRKSRESAIILNGIRSSLPRHA